MQPKDGGKIFTPQESTEMLQYIVTTMASGFERLGNEIAEIKKVMVTKDDLKSYPTKEDLKSHPTTNDLKTEFRASEIRMMDYTDKRLAQMENRLLLPLRQEDEKVDEVIVSAEQRDLFDHVEARRLKNLGPFPKLSAA